MKSYLIILVLAALVLNGSAVDEGHGEAEAGSRVFLLGSKPNISVAGNIGTHYSFYADFEQICEMAPWDPCAQEFPLDLSTAARNGLHCLALDELGTNKAELISVVIRRLSLSREELTLRKKSPADLTNRWSIALKFSLNSRTPQVLTAVLLLDGTCATMVKEPPPMPIQHSKHKSHSSLFMTNIANSIQGGNLISAERSDYVIPDQQWNPQSESFPARLSALALAAKQCLQGRYQSTVIPFLWLKQVSVDHFVPVDAIEHLELPLTEHLNHWNVWVTYTDGVQEHTVAMRLDGTVYARSP